MDSRVWLMGVIYHAYNPVEKMVELDVNEVEFPVQIRLITQLDFGRLITDEDLYGTENVDKINLKSEVRFLKDMVDRVDKFEFADLKARGLFDHGTGNLTGLSKAVVDATVTKITVGEDIEKVMITAILESDEISERDIDQFKELISIFYDYKGSFRETKAKVIL